ncbi:MAG: CDP-glycerol glycerophosphotransferase family protein [Propionibacteriaceae bacterium]
MPFHAPSLSTWLAAPSSPDGAGGGLTLSRLLVGLGSAALAVVGLLLVLTGGHPWPGLVVAGAGMLVAAIPALPRPGSLLGSHILLRMITLFTVTAAYLDLTQGPAWLPAVAAAIGVVVLAGEPLLRTAVTSAPLATAHLPGVPDSPGITVQTWVVPAATTVQWIGGGVLAVVGAPAWIWILTSLLIPAAAIAVGLDGLRHRLSVVRARRAMAAAVHAYQPEFFIYAGRQEDAAYQVQMWLPYLERTGRRFMIMTRAPRPAATLAGLTDVPVICCRTVSDIESVLTPSLTTVFYPNAASSNGQLVRYGHLTHVHLGHGDSDKATSYSPLHAMYDVIFSAGPAAIARYGNHGVHIPADRFRIVGRPQVEAVQQADGPIRGVEQPTVLYAPTWCGHVDETRYYSIPRGERIVQRLLDRGATVVFRPHPFNFDVTEDANTVLRINELLRRDAERTGRQHVWGEQATGVMSLYDCFNRSDAMISDVSGVVSDFLFSQKPLAMYAIGAREQFIQDYPVSRAAYLLDSDLANIDQVLGDLLGEDPQAPVRADLAKHYLGDLPADHYSEVFVRTATGLITGTDPLLSQHEHSAAEVDRSDSDEGSATEASGADRAEGPPTADPPTDDPPTDESPTTEVVPEPTAPSTGPKPSRGGRRGGLLTRGEMVAAAPLLAAILAAATAVTVTPVGVPAVLAVLALLAVTWSGQQPRLRRPTMRALASWVPVRALLAVTVTAIAIRAGDVSAPARWLLLGSLLLALVCEVWVRQSRSVRRLRVRQLDTLPHANKRPPAQRWMFGLDVVPLWLALVLGVVGLPVWIAAGVALAGLALGVAMVVREQVLIKINERALADIRRAVQEYDPEFMVYFAARTEDTYQLAMWMPYFEQLGRRFLVVLRQDSALEPITELTSAPVVLCRKMAEVDQVTVPSMKAAFYVNNGLVNTHMVEHRDLTHVWLNHGDSEKPACFNPVHAIYDMIFSAGPAGVERYARHGVDIPREKFTVVGRPQLTGIREAESPIAEVEGPTVLYAPTWKGPYADSLLYSLPVGVGIVQGLIDRGCTVIFRAHPLNYTYDDAKRYIKKITAVLAADQKASGRQHRWGEEAERTMDLLDCFNASDAMVSDVSAVVTDYLQSRKPFAMYAPTTGADLMAEAPVAVASYVLNGDLENLDAVLDDLLHEDPLVQQRAETRDHYLGSFTGDPAAPFLEAAAGMIDSPSPAELADDH